jgi:hypothetical protein
LTKDNSYYLIEALIWQEGRWGKALARLRLKMAQRFQRCGKCLASVKALAAEVTETSFLAACKRRIARNSSTQTRVSSSWLKRLINYKDVIPALLEASSNYETVNI